MGTFTVGNASSVQQDIQPPAGEVWLITSIIFYGDTTSSESRADIYTNDGATAVKVVGWTDTGSDPVCRGGFFSSQGVSSGNIPANHPMNNGMIIDNTNYMSLEGYHEDGGNKTFYYCISGVKLRG